MPSSPLKKFYLQRSCSNQWTRCPFFCLQFHRN